MTSILIADDNLQLVNILSEYSCKEGYKVYKAFDGQQALDIFESNDISVILLDIAMPKKDGFQVCKLIRQHSKIPIIMITAKGEDFEKIMGLDLGADDYIVKPFSPAEVMARVRAVLRRLDSNKEFESQKDFIHDDLKISIKKFSVKINDTNINLTKKEIELLYVMASRAGRVFTRDNLLDLIWGSEYFGDMRIIDSHIKRLRSKLDAVPHPSWQISTVWGKGYKFEELK